MLFSYEPENFIDLIKKRPGLWDRDHPEYKMKAARFELWDDLITELLDPDTKINKTDRRGLANQLQKKWKGFKDTYAKACKANRMYIHKKRLSFLTKKEQSKGTQSDDDGGDSDEDSHVSDGEPKKNQIIYNPTRKCQAVAKTQQKLIKTESPDDPIDVNSSDQDDECSPPKKERHELPEFICADPADDPDKMFLVSLLPDLKEIPSSQRLNVKLELMQVLQKYKNQLFDR